VSTEKHFEALYRILVDAEDLLSGAAADRDRPKHGSYEERVAAMNERGWDIQDASFHPTADEQPSDHANRYDAERSYPQAVSLSEEANVNSDGYPSPADADTDLSPEERRRQLDAIAEQIRSCQACPLSMGRNNAVPGEGALDPMVMIVGEGPGYNEDQQGRPFVGKAGHYLDKWLEAIGITREDSAFIANIVKCRPPNNRDPKPEEIDVCSPYLIKQIALVRPRMIVTVGRISTRMLTGSTQGITRIHGTFFRYNGIPLVPTFHPSAVLRNPAYRRPVWEDLKKVRNWLIDNAGHHPQDSEE
jgi:DNA polymerase